MIAKTRDPTAQAGPTTRALTKDTCALVKDETPESDEAERLLREAGIPLVVIPPGRWGKRKLELQTAEEYGTLKGIQGVRAYIAWLRIRARAGSVPEEGSVSGSI